MYIEQTTAADRLIIGRSLYCVFDNLDSASYLLSEIQDTYFDDYEQKPISKIDAEGLAIKLRIVSDIVWDAILTYHLTVGNKDFRGCAPYFESTERASLAAKVEHQLTTAFPGVGCVEERKKIMSLPDKRATNILDGVICGDREQ